MTMKKLCALLPVLAMLSACATNTQTGALAGGGGGALLGGGIGALAGGTKGALIGAALGGVAGGVSGALIGRYMDKQQEEINRDLQSGYVERVGNKLVVKFENGILFETGQASLKPQAQHDLGEFAKILQKYPDTNVSIEGFTDSVGNEAYNRRLSQERADAVVAYLSQAGVARARLVSEGFGEARPVASNSSEEGRAKNRRVEIHITANEQLKQADAENAAKKG
ncbi:MAG TPA: OmpA family protein [Myxococcales bacterium]|nr:OmpA family protein [Myxococcales bacterium]